MTKKIWLRAECKPFEKRTPLVPLHAKTLIASGFQVFVEKSNQRFFSNDEYLKVGCKLVDEYSWPNAPHDAYILGIKELQEDDFPLVHTHLYFAHLYKGQHGAEKILKRFIDGKGTLLDMEYLVDFRNQQLVTKAAGFWAGFCGAAASLIIWYQKNLGVEPPFKIKDFYPSEESLLDELKTLAEECAHKDPKILIIGPRGMTGTGAISLMNKLKFNYQGWYREDTSKNHLAKAIFTYDILLNCIMVDNTTPLFISPLDLKDNQRLSVIGDISCDPNSPHNPLPIYSESTTFKNPAVRVGDEHPIDIMAIDHITTLLPKESSYALAEQIFPFLCQLMIVNDHFQKTPWLNSNELYKKHCMLARQRNV